MDLDVRHRRHVFHGDSLRFFGMDLISQDVLLRVALILCAARFLDWCFGGSWCVRVLEALAQSLPKGKYCHELAAEMSAHN